jgi:D-3-phosphoglycerate dehydrogenase
MPRVLVTDQVFGGLEIERGVLEPLGVDLVEAPSSDEATLVELARTAQALLVCFAPVTAAVVDAAAAGGCRVIARYGIGYDNVDVGTATRHGIVVTNVPDYCLDEVADHAMALLLGVARGVVAASTAVRAGDWTVPQQGVHRLTGRRLALLGVGRIGRRLAARAQAFGLEVIAYDPHLEPWDIDGVQRAASVEEAVAEADFVSLHAPLTPDTRHVIGERTIAAMRRSPVVINTARGGLVDLDAAVAALEDGRIGGLALDVVEVEPLPGDHPLRVHPRAVITPHMGFYSVEAQNELQRRAAEEVARALRGEPARNPVNDPARAS